MIDPGHEEVEQIIKMMSNDVKAVYNEASKDIEKKLKDYWRRFNLKDSVKYAQWKAGEITRQEYDYWRTGQLMAGKRWEEELKTIAQDLLNADMISRSIVLGYMPDVYAVSYNYGIYQIERLSNMNTSFTLYDRYTVERIFRENPELLPQLNPYSPMARKIAEGKVLKWEKKQVTNILLQGILQGESNVDIGGRIRKVTKADWKSVVRYARTMTTGAENAGRVDSYKRAESMGIKLKQQWLATLDSRTRSSHRQLDGIAVEVGKAFPNGCKFPGDPEGPASEIWNCRCTLIPKLTGIPNLNNDNQHEDLSLRDTSHFENDDYQSWKNGKVKSDPILKAKEIGERRKAAAIADYREAAQRLGVR